MLKFFRKHSAGPLTKTLMLLLALTFVLWGIGDTLTRQNKVVAFKVADREVSYNEWQEALAQQIRAIEIEIGKKLTPEEVASFGLQKMVFNQLVNKMLLEKEASDMGLLVSDDMAKFEISSMPIFIKDGKFNDDAFYRFLNAIGISEDEFVSQIKGDIAVSNLKLALTLNKEFPKAYTDVLMKARSVEKNYDLYTFDRSKVKLAAKMTDLEANTIYEEQKELFALPEMRNIAYITLSADKLGGKVDINDSQVLDAYEARKDIYETPETRSVLQMVFKDKVQARDARKELTEGVNFLDVAKKYFPNKNDFSLGDKITADSFDDDISDELFSVKSGEFSNVVKSPLGYHIFFVKEVRPATVKSFEEVKEKLRAQLITEKRYEDFLAYVQDVEQESMGVDDLKEVAEKYSLKLRAMDSLIPSDATNDKNMKRARFADIAFSTQEGAVSNAYPLDENGGYFILQVKNVKPKEYKSLRAVKSQIEKIWQERKLNEEFAAIIRDTKNKIAKSGEKSEFLIKPQVSKGKTIDWNKAKESNLPEMLKEEILKAAVGVVTIPISSLDGAKFYVAKVNKVTPINTNINTTDLNLELAVSAMEVYLAQYLTYLRGKYDVQVFNLGEIE